MEPADIDWKTIDSRYVRDDAFENISAPKWVDLADADAAAVDDEAWFCRADCKHPKTFEDFQRWLPGPKAKLVRSNTEVLPLRERNRDAALKRRGGIGTTIFSSSSSMVNPKAAPKKFQEDAENLDPNLSTPQPPPRTRPLMAGGKTAKDAIKSSAEKRVVGDEGEEECQNKKPQRKLRSTLSARNLFSGKDILSQISEFCNELKKLATRKERNATAEVEVEKGEEEEEKKGLLLEVVVEEQGQKAAANQNSKRTNGSVKKSNRMTLRVETEKENCKKGINYSSSALKEVRENPPTPQRFPSPLSQQLRKAKASATTTISPLNKPPKSAALERGMLQEIEQRGEEKKALVSKDEECNKISDVTDAENRSVDMFWFLKPCTYLV